MPDVAMPRLSDSMEEGTILKWLKSDGDEVTAGEELVEIETDKANMTHEAAASGTLAIVAREGETLAVGATIARIGEGVPAAAPPEPEPVVVAASAVAAPASAEPAVKASPVARRIARERGLDLAGVTGSGPGGRIVKADVSEPAAEPAAGPAPVVAAAPEPAAAPLTVSPRPGDSGRGAVTHQELTRLQRTVSRRMAESKATAPDFSMTLEVEMDAAVELRASLKAAAGDAPVPSFNDFVVKAAALALRDVPRANGAYRDGQFELYSRVNVGVAVAAQDALVVPTIFDADTKSLGTIAADARRLAERVREGTVTPPELSSGTFTVSNLGMYGIKRFLPVINPPQAAILAVGELSPRAVVRDGEIVVRSIMELTLACDHRILYGADAAGFLARIRDYLEAPLRLAL